MQIIDYITSKTKHLFSDHSELQDFCLSKLRSSPLPDKNNEEWRLADKKKLSSLLDYQYSNEFYPPDIPKYLSSKESIKLFIGDKNKLNIKKDKWEIIELNKEEINKLIEDKLNSGERNLEWSNALNHILTKKENLIGIKISGNLIPPLEIYSNSKSDYFNSKTLILILEKNSKANILQINLGDNNSSLSLSSYILLEENSILNHGVLSLGKDNSNLLNTLNISQKPSSEYHLGSIQLKYNFARFEISVNQISGKAKTNIRGMQVSKDDEQIATYTTIKFNGPEGFLNQLNKSLANDKSHSIFDGSIIVPKRAQKTDASQLSRNLLLSNQAKIDTKPQLEIIADDVKCKHGATISQLNEDELFYMRSRGLTFAEASKLQLKSYYKEIITTIPVLERNVEFLDYLLNDK